MKTQHQSIVRPRTKQSVIEEYTESGELPMDSEKAMWGSEESMLNRFRLGLQTVDWSQTRCWLDVGCGVGRFFQVAEEAGHRFDLLLGLDITESLIHQARTRNFHSPVSFEIGDLENIDGSAADMDLVSIIGVLQLCGCPLDTAIRAATGRLKPGGQIFLTTKHLGWDAFEKDGLIPDANHSWFTYADVEAAVTNCGLDILKADGFLPAENRVVELVESHTLFIHAVKRS